MKKRFKKLNNKGFSLVELIVVIAIMAVGLGIVSISISTIFANNVRACATNVEALLSRAKVGSVYRDPLVYIEISNDGTNYIGSYFEGSGTGATPADPVETKVLGPSSIILAYDDGTGVQTIDTSKKLRIAFERGTGEMMLIGDAVPNPSVTHLEQFDDTASASIMLANGTSSRYTIELTPATGNFEVRRG